MGQKHEALSAAEILTFGERAETTYSNLPLDNERHEEQKRLLYEIANRCGRLHHILTHQ